MAGIIVVERSARILASPETIAPFIAELPRWVDWSPWEGIDPAMKRDYTGAAGEVGSTYSWDGNRKAGEGRMRISETTPERISIDLDFTRPFKSKNVIRFSLDRDGDATRVTWRMESPRTFFSRFFNLDKMVGADFEKGLRQLTQVTEGAA